MQYKWKISKQKGIVYYCETLAGLKAFVEHLAQRMHRNQKITIERTNDED